MKLCFTLLSHCLITTVFDAVTVLRRDCVSHEMLYAYDLALMSETIVGGYIQEIKGGF